jgi:hypothetical protein
VVDEAIKFVTDKSSCIITASTIYFRSYRIMLQDPAIEKLLDIRSIKPAGLQSRDFKFSSSLNKKTIQELVESIREYGLIQPITVRPVKHGFEIVAGQQTLEMEIYSCKD